MRDINIKQNNNGSIIDNSISIRANVHGNTFVVSSNSDARSEELIKPEINMKETSIRKLLFGRCKELLLAVISAILALASFWVLNNYEFQQTYKIIIISLLLIASAVTIGLVITALEGSIIILALKKKGVIRYLKSPLGLIGKILGLILDTILFAISTFFSSEGETPENSVFDSNSRYLSPKGVYQNFDGKIYELKYAKCPYCELEPIGKMHFLIDTKNSTYVLRCNQQKKHKFSYDYKKKYKNMKIIR